MKQRMAPFNKFEQLNELVEFSKSTNDQLKSLDYELKNYDNEREQIEDLTLEELLNRNYYRGRFASIEVNVRLTKPDDNNWEDTPLK